MDKNYTTYIPDSIYYIFVIISSIYYIDAPPYSYIALFQINQLDGSLAGFLRLYFISTDNRKTGYKGGFIAIDEGRKVYELVMEKSVFDGGMSLKPELDEDS